MVRWALLLLMLVGCASRPVSLVVLPPAPPPMERTATNGPSVLVREVTVPGYLDIFPVIVGRDGGTLVVSRDTEWAERPSSAVGRVVADALSHRLGHSRVLIEGERRIPDADLTVEFVALDARGGSLHLDARWRFTCTALGDGRGGRTELDVPVASATPAMVATAMTESLTRLADVLALEFPTECRPFADDLARRGH